MVAPPRGERMHGDGSVARTAAVPVAAVTGGSPATGVAVAAEAMEVASAPAVAEKRRRCAQGRR